MSDPQEVHVDDRPPVVDVEVLLERDEFNFVLSPVDAAGVTLFGEMLAGDADMGTWLSTSAHFNPETERVCGASYDIGIRRIRLSYPSCTEQQVIDELRNANYFGRRMTVDPSSAAERVVLVPSTRCKHCSAMLHTHELDYSTCDACAEKCDHGMSEVAVLRGILPVQPMYCGKCGRRNPKWGARAKMAVGTTS